jgi:hypothetical protein
MALMGAAIVSVIGIAMQTAASGHIEAMYIITDTIAAPIRAIRLPHFSAIGEAARAPKKHPA